MIKLLYIFKLKKNKKNIFNKNKNYSPFKKNI